jgi:replication factor A1
VASRRYEQVKDKVPRETFEEEVDRIIQEWGGLLDRDTAAMVVVERLGGSVAQFQRIADIQEGMEVNLRARVAGLSPVRKFTRQDGTAGRVVNLELNDGSGFCRFSLWDEDVASVEKGKIAVGKTVRAIDCYVKRTNFGLEVGKGKFGSLIVQEA